MMRPANLGMIALTQLLIKFFIINPALQFSRIEPSLSLFWYLVMVFATVLIAASGYIINDYFDQKTDSVNKPFRLMVHDYFTKQQIINIHLGLNFVAVALAFSAAIVADNFRLSFIYAVTAGLLWFYSSSFKKMFLIGNIIVSFLTALVVMLPVMFELPSLMQQNAFGQYDSMKVQAIGIILYTSTAYFIFALLTTFIREMVKDMEDLKGDMATGASTLPAILGLQKTKLIAVGFWLLLMVLIGWVQQMYWNEGSLLKPVYLLIAIQLPSLAGIFLLIKTQFPEGFAKISLLLKIIMVFGILSMAVFYFFNHL